MRFGLHVCALAGVQVQVFFWDQLNAPVIKAGPSKGVLSVPSVASMAVLAECWSGANAGVCTKCQSLSVRLSVLLPCHLKPCHEGYGL